MIYWILAFVILLLAAAALCLPALRQGVSRSELDEVMGLYRSALAGAAAIKARRDSYRRAFGLDEDGAAGALETDSGLSCPSCYGRLEAVGLCAASGALSCGGCGTRLGRKLSKE